LRSWHDRSSPASSAADGASAWAYAERHDNIEAIYKKIEEKRDTADVTRCAQELHHDRHEAIRAQEPGEDQR